MKGSHALVPQWTERNDKVVPARQHIALLLDLLSNRGVNMHYALRNTGIFYQDLIERDLMVSPAQLARLIHNMTKLEQFPDLSFLSGQQLIPGAFSDSSHLIVHAATVRELIGNFVAYSEIYFPLLKLRERMDETGLYLFEEDPFGEASSLSSGARIAYRRWLIEYVFTSIISATNWRADKKIPWSVKVDWSAPCWQEQYDVYWGKVEFKQSMASLFLPKECLELTISDRSSTLYKVAQQTTSLRPCGLLSFIRERLQQNQQQVLPSLNDLSEMMNISPATLKRRLKSHSSTYRLLLSEINRQNALYLQEIHKLDDVQIARRMNFFDVSNYRRAVRRWGAN
ncbi:AraC family transcriptional regulator ligand-binding domain-containing protein [Vibrio sp. STUT-A11]|uniref:AraC family transcriptional regulator ligand-binding domain-containing protein n=1 Tax=Vibrio sp. STUT-A11 TaxID=2976236 RepID=UPI0022319B6B|nr:AraC family transcriptional regulator ligand-binding domain-containing protein [Vibrio sp. STUT-A11]